VGWTDEENVSSTWMWMWFVVDVPDFQFNLTWPKFQNPQQTHRLDQLQSTRRGANSTTEQLA